MGIYLPNMEMPTGDEMLCINIFPDGKVTSHFDLRCMPVTKAVPVPEHGRLIDADALEENAQKRLLMCNKNDNQFQKPYEVMRAIALAPTVIQADGKDTNVPTREEGE